MKDNDTANANIKALLAIALMVLGIGTVIFSDIYIRAGGRDGLNGIDARSYDVTGSLMLGVGAALAIIQSLTIEQRRIVLLWAFIASTLVVVARWIS